MRIYKMTATFGKLENQTLTLTPGLNMIEAPNEWGKSTWCAFLLAMLYGLDTRAKSTKTTLADKERYAPWSGSPMSGRVDLHWQGRDITIERNTRGRVPMGEFRAYETATGLPVPELTAHTCGEVLLGVESSVFRRAGFLRLSDLPVTQDEALRRRLSNLVTTGDESGDGERLARELKELKNRIRYNRTGLLPQAEGEREGIIRKLEALDALEAQRRKLRERLEETRDALRELENHKIALAYARAEAGAARLAQARDARDRAEEQFTSLEQDCAKLPAREEAEEKLRLLREFRSHWELTQTEARMQPQPPEESPQEGPFQGLTGQEALEQARRDAMAYGNLRDTAGLRIWWVLSLLALAAAGALAFMTDWPYALIALAVGLGILGLALRKRQILQEKAGEYEKKYGSADPDLWLLQARKYENTQKNHHRQRLEYQQARGELDSRLQRLEMQRQSLCGGQSPEKVMEIWQQILDRWEELYRLRREFRQAEELFQALQETAVPVKPPPMTDTLNWSEEETERLLQDTREEQHRLSSRLGQLQGRMEALGDRSRLVGERDRVGARIRRLEETYAALTIGLDTLSEARRELQRRFAPRIAGRAARLLAQLTEGRYDRLTFSEDFALLAGAQGETTLQSALWRSDGTVDQLYLSLRLAVAEELTPHAPLILDDALARFDDRRMKAALEILREMAREKQVILFTCQSREKQLQ